MAAATIANRREQVWGNARVVFADVTIAASGDTWATGLKKVMGMQVTPTTNASAGATKSGATVTFVTGGALVMSVLAYGY